MKIKQADIQRLLEKAKDAKENAYAPYSNFRVGACLLDDKGNEYQGCNVENASYGAAICAERTAMVKAVSCGSKNFVAIAITSDSEDPTYPCGICRQVLVEFSPDMDVISSNSDLSVYTVYSAGELIKHHFGPESL